MAVVGGGCAAMAAAFELTRPALAGRYEVTVYQLGWRLGGKGASGRGPAGRIEEHGLHLWMGFYENAFRIMRECYAELGRDPATCPIADWRDAFTPAQLVGVMDRGGDGPWRPWLAELPHPTGLPGDPDAAGRRWTIADYLVRSAAMLRALFASLTSHAEGGPHGDPTRARTNGGDGLPERVTQLLRVGELATLTAVVEAVGLLELVLGQLGRLGDGLVLRLLDAVSAGVRRHIAARAEHDVELRRLWIIADLTLATMRGVIRFGLVTDPRGFDAIDDYDCREWLRLNGASEPALGSGYLAGLYDLGFSYEDGDAARPRIAAGQALRSMVRAFFTYRTAFFWRMEAGMGDVVFAPFYEVLARRGVRFAFFHRLENVGLATSGPPHVERLEFDVQAFVRDGVYRPLVDVGGLPCWPAEPDWRQLVDGERCRQEGWRYESHWDRRRMATRTLSVGEDFDLVVLGVGLGAVPHVCRELVARDPRWRAMVDNVKTVATQAFQLWLSADMASLGWSGPAPAVSGFVEPFDTWADMRHLLAREAWTVPPRALAYFCNVLPDDPTTPASDPAYPLRQYERVRENAVRFLDRDVGHLWPRAARRPGEFRWDLLVAGDDAGAPADGPARFATQFWTANVNPTDRYTLSLPGSSAYRISPLDDTYDNLTIAGDWTACGFNAGCVEAAVMSGRLAAHAIAQAPPLEDIVGYDHP